MNKRTENKYYINAIDSKQLEIKLKSLCQKYSDEHTQYSVRSLYFDDLYNKAFYEKEEGFLQKEKFRIRIYNKDFENIYLERKTKNNNTVTKDRCKIDKETANTIIKNEFNINENCPKTIQKFYIEQHKKLFSPKIIIEYERTVFSFPIGNTRITLDKNIKSSHQVEDFFNKNVCSKEILPKGINILEIKYSGIFPPFLTSVINMENLEKINYSKYYNGRKLFY